MKKYFQPKYIPLIALTGGGLGFLLRLWLYATGMEENGLLRTDHPANWLAFVLTALVLGAVFLCLRPLAGIPSYKRLFKPSVPAAAGSIAAAAGILAADIYEFSHQMDNVAVLSWVLSILACLSLVILGLCRIQGKRPNLVLHGCVTVYLMVHLISQYRFWNAEPQLQKYVFPLLASVFLMLTAYHRTTLDARSGSRRWYAFFNSGAVFFCCLALLGEQWLFYLAMAVWTATADYSLKPAAPRQVMALPEPVRYCIRTLEGAGYQAYAVGGCVRDTLLGLTPQDYDLCTSATPEEIAGLFARHDLVRSGEKHGTIGVVLEGQVYEITTFRTEGGYSDSRHPDWVEFVGSVKEDLARRDFTVNAIAYNPRQGYADPWGGQTDLKNRILRTVGDPEQRFREDPLRILRGVRFAIRYGLTPEDQTLNAMLTLAPLMDTLARERVFSELCKILPLVTAGDLLRYAPIITQVVPELAPTVGFDQHSPYHAYNLYTHTAVTVEAVPAQLSLRLAALLHDIGKPGVFSLDEEGRGHFYGHAKAGALLADQILLRLKAPNTLRSRVVLLVEQHMTPLEPDKKLLRRRLGQYGEETLLQLLALQRADFGSKGADEEDDIFRQVELAIRELQQEVSCLTAADLAIDGNDLLALGQAPGPRIGQCMTFLLELVQDELIANTRETLLSAAQRFFEGEPEEDTL